MTDQHKEYRIEGRPPTIFKIMNREDKPYVVMDRRPLAASFAVLCLAQKWVL